jgi:hypothetical protein
LEALAPFLVLWIAKNVGWAVTAQLPAPANKGPRVIRVFVSSTFRDMQEEREVLIKRIFPQLRRLCEQRGVVWGEVDLRWGVTEEEARHGKVVRLCLEEIDRCRPFFLGLLGERYGWVPREEQLAQDPELLEKHPWVADKVREGCSVTELEIEHGVFRNSSQAGTTFFYVRDSENQVGTGGAAPPADYEEREEGSRQKLAALKRRLRAGGGWTCADYADPPALGRQVLKDFTALLEQLYPAEEVPGPLRHEATAHRAFADARARAYVGRQERFDRLEAHVAGHGPPLIIFGEPGVGKSALLANWLGHRRGEPLEGGCLIEPWWRRAVRSLRRPVDPAGPAHLVLHCIGATPQSTTWPALARRVLGDLVEQFGLTLDVPAQPAPLRTALVRGLALAAARGRVLLILDGLDQLEDRHGPVGLNWLPEEVPSGVRLIVSCRRGPALGELRRRRWAELEVKPLGRAERRVLVSGFLSSYGKRLSSGTVEEIAGAGPTATPLYLRTLLEELRVLGRHEDLSARLRHYIAAATTADLFGRVLARWEEDFDPDRPGLVRDTMAFLWASRSGLTERELLELLKADDDPLPAAVWSPLYLAAESLLVNHSGLLTFVHPEARDAVERAYLPGERDRQWARRRLADYFAQRLWSPRTIEELPWQLTALAAWEELASVLADPQFLTNAWATRPQELKAHWAQVEQASPLRLVHAHRRILEAPEQHAEAAWALSVLLADTGHLNESLALGTRLEAAARASGDRARLGTGLAVRAVGLAMSGNVRGGLKLLREQEQLCRQRGDQFSLAVNIGNQGAFLRDLGDREAALAQHREAEKLCRALEDWVGVAACLGNQGVLCRDQRLDDDALELFRQQEAICRAQGDLAGLQASLGNQAAMLRGLGQLDQALKLHQEEEALCRRLYSRDGLQKCLGNQARLLQDQEDYDAALDRLKAREAICREDGYQEDLARVLSQQACLFGVKLGEVEHAQPLAEEALRWAKAASAGPLAAEIQELLAHLRGCG